MNKENKSINELDTFFTNLIPTKIDKWLNIPYFKPLNIIQNFIYPDSVNQLRPGNGKIGDKMNGGPQYVVIHDTGMPAPHHNAYGLNKYIHDQANSLDGRVASWHFSVDENTIFQHIPTDEVAWHAGDGSTLFGETYINKSSKLECIGGGNKNGIGIETCIEQGGNYDLTLKNAAKLTATLLNKYHLGIERVKQHFNFSGKNCPNVIRSLKGRWESFLKDVEIELFLLKYPNLKGTWESNHPEIILPGGGIKKPIITTTVEIKISIEVDSFKKDYFYNVVVEGMDDEERIENSYLYLYSYFIPKEINNDINLPLKLDKYNTSLIWESSNPNILSNDGKVKQYNKEVTLNVLIKTNNKEKRFSFLINISNNT